MLKDYIDALRPLWSRMVTSHCWQKSAGRLLHTKQPFTVNCWREHLQQPTATAYGLAFIAPGESTTRVAALDLDDHTKSGDWASIADAAERLSRAFEAHGIYLIPFRSSGGAGAHLYALWEHAQDAYSVRQLFRKVLAECGYGVGTKGLAAQQIELFPKQDEVAPDAFGSMIFLPLAGESVPLDLLDFYPLTREDTLTLQMPLSRSVAACKRPVTRSLTPALAIGLESLKTMLDAIPNTGIEELPYEDTETGRSYLNVIFALHDATEGNHDGLTLALEWAAKSTKFNENKTTNDWHAAGRSSKPVTLRTLMQIAQHYGWREPLEQDLTPLPPTSLQPLPTFERDKQGKITNAFRNYRNAMMCPSMVKAHFAFDAFRHEIIVTYENMAPRVIQEVDYLEMVIRLERCDFARVEKIKVYDAVQYAAYENRFDSAINWINALTWDGIPRIDFFVTVYLGADDTSYTRAVSQYLWTALAGRILEPGCMAPMVPILVGAQGLRKSTSVEALAPLADSFGEISLGQTDEENALKLKGLLVAELSELRGLATKDMESIRAFVSRKQERWRQKYDKHLTVFSRRCLFFGTANESEILADTAGNRRWLPFSVERLCDNDAIFRDREQLWAEARERFLHHGVLWQDAERLAREVHPRYEIDEPWLPIIERWLDTPDDFDEGHTPNTKPFLITHEILEQALHLEKSRIDRKASVRLSRIMRHFGYVSSIRRLKGQLCRVWSKA